MHAINTNMLRNFKQKLKESILATGFDIYFHPLSPHFNDSFQLYKSLKRFDIDLVFDIGANVGQFASDLRSIGYKGEIVSFEPLSDAYQRLKVAAANDAKWHTHSQTAIGDFNGEIEINISKNSQSSSILPMLDAHLKAAPKSKYTGKEKVEIARLDSIASPYLSRTVNYFIKIDTQGFEEQVLDGAQETLAKARGVLCELSLVPLYEGQRLWLDVIKRLRLEGFNLWAIQKGIIDPCDGQALQINAIFFRCDAF